MINNNILRWGRKMGAWSERNRSLVEALRVCGLCVLINVAFIIIITVCHASEVIPADRAVHAIIGEAEDQGWLGMRAIAYTIRNRGTLKGVYGEKAPRVMSHKYNQAIYEMAKRQWLASENGYDITHGATGWGNESDLAKFKRSKWFKNCIITAKIGGHIFYKERRVKV